MTALCNPMILLLLVMWTGAVSSLSYFTGAKHATDHISAEVNAERAAAQEKARHAIEVAVEAVATEARTQLDKNRKVIRDYEKRIRDLEQPVPDGGLRVPRSICGDTAPAGQAVAEGARPVDGASAGTVALPEPVTTHLYALAYQCDATAEQLRSFQEWAREHGLDGG